MQDTLPLGNIPYGLPEYVSPSSIGTFQQCPLKFKFYKLDKLPSVSTEAQVVGSFVHEILENLFKFDHADRTISNARALARHLWHEKWSKEFNSLSVKSVENDFRWKVWWCIEHYFKLEDPSKVTLVGVEYPVRGLINEVPVFGIVDRWHLEDDRLVISDYKTGNKPSSTYEWEKKMQISIYAMLLQAETGKDLERSELFYLKSPKIVSYNLSEDIVDKVTEQVTETWTSIKSSCATGEFEAKPSRLCDWCDYKKICPVWN